MPFLYLALLLYSGACAYLYLAQRTYLYFPTPQTTVADAEMMLLGSDGETLRLWHVGPSDGHAIIYFGGNSEDVAENIPFFREAFPERAIYLLNYRGYGGSTGRPSEAGLFKDASAVFDFVRERHATVSVIGRSLGSGVALFLAGVRETAKLVLVTPYDSIENVAKKQFPLFPIAWLLKDKFASASRARVTSTPTLVMLAEQDNVVPHANSKALIAAFPVSIAQVLVVPDTDHNSIGMSADYWAHLRAFL